jgi:hypothetical protein
MTALEVAQAGRWGDWHGLEAGDDEVVVIDDPPEGDGLGAAGPAQLVAPARHELYGYETTDHVWPQRGLVLVGATPYEHTPASDRAPRIVRAELFAPCTLEHWRAAIAPRTAPRRPQRR